MLLRYLMRTLEDAFLIGLAGSLAVATISFWEDVHEALQQDRVRGPPQRRQRMRRAHSVEFIFAMAGLLRFLAQG